MALEKTHPQFTQFATFMTN